MATSISSGSCLTADIFTGDTGLNAETVNAQCIAVAQAFSVMQGAVHTGAVLYVIHVCDLIADPVMNGLNLLII